MIETFALVVRWLHAGSSVLLIGTLGFLLLLPDANNLRQKAWHRRWLTYALLFALATLLLGLSALAFQSTLLAHSQSIGETAITLLRESRFGHVLTLRVLAIVILVVLLSLALRFSAENRFMHLVLLVIAAAVFAASAWAGHSAAEEPAAPALAAHGLHLVSLSLWLGALPALYSFIHLFARIDSDGATAARMLQRFSLAATIIMPLIVVSGVGLAVVHVRVWPALFGTGYGSLVLFKAFALVGVLWIAAKLRWQFLPRLVHSNQLPGQILRWLRLELLLGFAILVAAATLAQSVPARHDAIQWPWPFRWSVEALAEIPDLQSTMKIAVLTGLIALIAAGALWWRRKRVQALIATVVATSALAITLWSLSLEAYPETYRKPTVPYQTVSIARGVTLFAKQCVSCHGENATGNGPLASGMIPPPANLTEPHTALHTAGDIFRWLSVGMPPSAMPGFSQQLSEDDRWDVINYLRTLSVGYQARIIGDRVIASKPWLAAIDFDYVDVHQRSGALKDFREKSVVLLVLHTGTPESFSRLGALRSAITDQHLRSITLVSAGSAEMSNQTSSPPEEIRIHEGAEEIVLAYGLLRRSVNDADADNLQPIPAHQEFLVDKYGFIRARWNPRHSDLWRDFEYLQQQIDVLDREKKLREPPEDHVH